MPSGTLVAAGWGGAGNRRGSITAGSAYPPSPSLLIPQVWLDYAQWHSDGGGAGQAAAVAVLQRGVRALPGCPTLSFAMADVEELAGRIEEAKQVRERWRRALWGI